MWHKMAAEALAWHLGQEGRQEEEEKVIQFVSF